jgi:hypothetical protein
VINEAELREMTPAQRRELARALAAIDYPRPLLGNWLARGRMVGALVSVAACVVLLAWIVVLGLTLHRSFHAQHWRGAWVGFDVFLLGGFAATGWAFWRGRQIVIACLLVTGTLLGCDAWFDVILDLSTRDAWVSIASALLAELPVAVLMFRAASRLIRLSALVAVSEFAAQGDPDGPGGAAGPAEALPPLWKIPLFGNIPASPGRPAAGPRGAGDR